MKKILSLMLAMMLITSGMASAYYPGPPYRINHNSGGNEPQEYQTLGAVIDEATRRHNEWISANPKTQEMCHYTIETKVASDIKLDVRRVSPNATEFVCGPDVYAIVSPLLSIPNEDNLGKEKCSAGSDCGNPINVAMRSKFQEEVDFNDGYGFARYYNSRKPARTEFIGNQWTHTYDKRIDSFFDKTSGRAYASFLRADGGASIYRLENGVWISDFDTGWTLSHSVGGNGNVTAWVAKRKGGNEIERYDASGRLIEISLFEKKYVVSYLTDSPDVARSERRVRSVTDNNGRTISFAYNANGNIERVTNSDGSTYTYGYDAQNRLTSVTYPGGASRQYQYITYQSSTGNLELLSGVVDESGVQFATYGYSGSKAVSTEHAGANKYSASYSGDLVTLTTPLGAIEKRTFKTVKGIWRAIAVETSCAGCQTSSTSYTFDANGNPDLILKSSGEEVDYDYNDRGLATEKRERSSGLVLRTTATEWHPIFSLPVSKIIKNADGYTVQEIIWTYNTRGQLLTQTQRDPIRNESRATSYTYCEQSDIDAGVCPMLGLVTKIDFPRMDVSDVVTFKYYQSDAASCAANSATCEYRKGDLWKVTNALGQTAEIIKYDGVGRVLSEKSAHGVITDFVYHPRGWLVAKKIRGINNSSETDDEITTIDYWETGLVKKISRPDGASSNYTYDAAHRLTDITDDAGSAMHFELDGAGKVVKEETRDAAGTLKRTLSRIYNELGQLSSVKDAKNQAITYTYDASGRPDTATDALGRISERDYDPLGRLARDLRDSGGIGAENQYEHDLLDNLTKVTDPNGLETKYTYNALGDLLMQESPDTGSTTYAYDDAGNLASQVDANGTAKTYTYDALNRVTKVAFPNPGYNVSYTYDVASAVCGADETFNQGLLSRVADVSGSTAYCYDRFGNLTRKEQETNGKHFVLRYSYGKDGAINTLTYPDGVVVDYVRGVAGKVVEIGVTQPGKVRQLLLSQISYAPFGPPRGWAFGNGRSIAYTYDLNYQPESVTDQSSDGLSARYTYDEVGNLKQLETADQTRVLARYGYDRLDRLTDAMDGPTSVVIDHYDYDPTGNRTGYSNNAGLTSYGYISGSHRLSSVGSVVRSYDNAGNTLSIGGAAKGFVYGEDNRLSQVTSAGAVVASYAYNGKGEKVRQSSVGSETYSLYDEEGHLVGVYGGTGAPVQQVIWFGNKPVGLLVGQAAAQSLLYIESDQLDTPRVVVDPVRDVAVWKWDVKGEAFGSSSPVQDPDSDGISLVLNLRYPGQVYDSVSGLLYNYQRDYDPTTGRYVQSDPLGLLAGVSTYGYVGGSPLMWSDPFGLLKWKLNDVQWNNTWGPGQYSETYPGDGKALYKDTSLARTTLDWRISPACMCANSSYNLQEFEVEFTPIVLMRPRYESFEMKSSTRRDEMQHVNDFRNWINSARAGAQQIEDSLKAVSYPDQVPCEESARDKMRVFLEEGADQAAEESRRRWDLSGKHRYIDRSR